MDHRYGVALVWLLALAILSVMVGTGSAPPVVLLAAGQVALYLAVVRHRAPGAALRIPVLWSVQAGLTWAVAGSPSPESVVAFVAVGLVFAVAGHVVLQMVGRAADRATPDDEHSDTAPPDTAPLPVVDGSGSVQDTEPDTGRP